MIEVARKEIREVYVEVPEIQHREEIVEVEEKRIEEKVIHVDKVLSKFIIYGFFISRSNIKRSSTMYQESSKLSASSKLIKSDLFETFI